MSTTTPAAETRTATENSTTTETTTEKRAITEERTDGRRPTTTTRTGRTDPWADSTADAPTDASLTAPRTFDPFCIRRLRNCIDGENAALPDTD